MDDYSKVGDLLLKEGSLTFAAAMFEAVNQESLSDISASSENLSETGSNTPG